MGVEHAHALYVHGHSALHRLPPEVKLAAAFGFVLAVAVTPREAVWAFAAYAVVLVGLFAFAGITASFVFARIAAVLPFILFAFLIPFIASGERIEVLGIPMSADGLWSAWGIVAKATLGIAVSILLAGTTGALRMSEPSSVRRRTQRSLR